jgi:hypothetical protein
MAVNQVKCFLVRLHSFMREGYQGGRKCCDDPFDRAVAGERPVLFSADAHRFPMNGSGGSAWRLQGQSFNHLLQLRRQGPALPLVCSGFPHEAWQSLRVIAAHPAP